MRRLEWERMVMRKRGGGEELEEECKSTRSCGLTEDLLEDVDGEGDALGLVGPGLEVLLQLALHTENVFENNTTSGSAGIRFGLASGEESEKEVGNEVG